LTIWEYIEVLLVVNFSILVGFLVLLATELYKNSRAEKTQLLFG
jgi:hypothetical protein